MGSGLLEREFNNGRDRRFIGPDDRELVAKTFLATGACQHRGKATTGMAVGNSKGIYIFKGLGRIAEVIDYNIRAFFRTFTRWPLSAISVTRSVKSQKIQCRTDRNPADPALHHPVGSNH